MNFVYDDGGRAAAGFKGKTGDCVVRAIAIATGLSYAQVYSLVNEASAKERPRKGQARSSARTGVFKPTYKRVLTAMGWQFTPTMGIGTGCKVHLVDGELPVGRLIVSLSKHLTCVIDGTIHDTHNPQRSIVTLEPDRGQEMKSGQWRSVNGKDICTPRRRCVYGYWRKS